MSASKKDELLRSLTRKAEQRPPMEVTYEQKGAVLDQLIGEQQNLVNAKQQNSKTANKQNFVNAEKQESKTADEQNFATAQQQTLAAADKQNGKYANVQNSKYANLRRITFHIPEEVFKQLKLISIEEDLTMLEIGAQMALAYVNQKRYPEERE